MLFSVVNKNEEFKKCFPSFRAEYSYTIKHFTYILVYNPANNNKFIDADKKGWKRLINTSYFDSEIEYFRLHYSKFFSRPADIRKYEKKVRNLEVECPHKGSIPPEQYAVRKYFEERINDGFCNFIKDIRAKMEEKETDSEFDVFAEFVMEEADSSYQVGKLPQLVRFGLDKFEGSYVKSVFTYAGACKQKDNTYNYYNNEFYFNFVKKYEQENESGFVRE